MTNSFNRLKLIFLGLFAIATAGVLVYHMLWVWPAQRCEERGAWWDPETRICATPIPLYRLTGRGGPGQPPVGGEKPVPKPAAAPAKPPQPAR